MRVRRDVSEIREQQTLAREVTLIELLKERPNREFAQATRLHRIPDLDVELPVARRRVSFLPRLVRNRIFERSYAVRTRGFWQGKDRQRVAQEGRRTHQQQQREGAERTPHWS